MPWLQQYIDRCMQPARLRRRRCIFDIRIVIKNNNTHKTCHDIPIKTLLFMSYIMLSILLRTIL